MTNHHTVENYAHHTAGLLPQLILALPFTVALVVYIMAVIVANHKSKRWFFRRIVYWFAGSVCAVAAVAGPLAQRAHGDFTYHMLGHLLLGMLAPFFMALAAPMTLMLRALPVTAARQLASLLKGRPVHLLRDPVLATVLNIGGLWILYTTDLYTAMHQHIVLYIFIHLHVFFAGYLFTISMIYIDPTPYRTSYLYRSIVFIIALAGHSILAKYLYAHPPEGVPAEQAETASMLMYYGGDMIDLFIIFIFCSQWYKAAKPRSSFSKTVDLHA